MRGVVCALLLLALLAGPAYAVDGVKAGKWEFFARAPMPIVPKLPPGVRLPVGVNIGAGGVDMTRARCVDSSNPVPADVHERNQQHGQCKVAKLDSTGGTLRWETTCTPADAALVQSQGTGRHVGDSIEAEIKTVVFAAGRPPQENTQRFDGRYLESCNGK